MEGKYFNAKAFFHKGLSDEGKVPLLRGTYTWLNKYSLALTYRKLGFDEESNNLFEKAMLQMKQLGISDSHSTINVYSQLMSNQLKAH
jgi:hypothetical protein